MKIDLDSDELDPYGYDRDNGKGAAESAIKSLKETNDPNSERIELDHKERAHNSALELKGHLAEESTFSEEDGIGVLHLGFGDFADKLQPKIDKVILGGESQDEEKK